MLTDRALDNGPSQGPSPQGSTKGSLDFAAHAIYVPAEIDGS